MNSPPYPPTYPPYPLQYPYPTSKVPPNFTINTKATATSPLVMETSSDNNLDPMPGMWGYGFPNQHANWGSWEPHYGHFGGKDDHDYDYPRSNRARDRRRSSVFHEIDFVQSLSSKLNPPKPKEEPKLDPPDNKLKEELDALKKDYYQGKRDAEVAAALGKARAEGKSEGLREMEERLKKEREEAKKMRELEERVMGGGPGAKYSAAAIYGNGTGITSGGDIRYHFHRRDIDISPISGLVSGRGDPLDHAAYDSFGRRRNADSAEDFARPITRRLYSIEDTLDDVARNFARGQRERDRDRERHRGRGREVEREAFERERQRDFSARSRSRSGYRY